MTTARHVLAGPPDGSAAPIERCLAIARRALRARNAALVDGDVPGIDGPGDEAVLTADVAPAGGATATLVVTDHGERRWSEEDAALLRDIAAMLADALRPRENVVDRVPPIEELPCLVFEARKTGALAVRCTVFGGGGMLAPGVREWAGADQPDVALANVHREDQGALHAALLECVGDERDLDVTFRVDGSGRSSRWLRSQATVRRDPDGAVIWSGICSDVTDVVARAIMLAGTAVSGQPEEHPSAAEEGSTMPRILLADDLDLNRKLICDMLSLDGYDVDSVADGAAAVEAVKAKSYDLVLMDMIMPGMDGIDATRAIRALPAPTCDVPIVALTAHSFREQLDDCLHAGMNATLTKPMSFEALSTAVSLWARSRRQAA